MTKSSGLTVARAFKSLRLFTILKVSEALFILPGVKEFTSLTLAVAATI